MFEASPQPMMGMGNNGAGKTNEAGKNMGANTLKNYEQNKTNN